MRGGGLLEDQWAQVGASAQARSQVRNRLGPNPGFTLTRCVTSGETLSPSEPQSARRWRGERRTLRVAMQVTHRRQRGHCGPLVLPTALLF